MSRVKVNQGWSYRPAVSMFQELAGAAGADWTDVLLPHDALISTPRQADVEGGETSGYFAGGAFQYRKSFAVAAEDRGNLILLEFDGVYRDAMVYVNDALAGQHAFGYSRFLVRIDPYLKFGEDNEIRVDCRTHLDSRWYAGGGIYRDVFLITKDPLHIAPDGVRITTPDIEADRAVVEVEVEVENGSGVTSTSMLTAAIVDSAGEEVASGRSPVSLLPGDAGTVRLRLYVPDPALWSIDAPALYSARLELRDGDRLVDEQVETFGIRSLQVDPLKGLRINGEAVKLRGACIHSDNGPLGMASIARAEERRVELLKAAGFNAIRSAHNPMSSALLDACDRVGVVVMDETFDMWTSSKSSFDYASSFPQWWERDIEALVAKDFNHPSVVFYSIGNEIPETGNPIGAVWGRRLAEKIRSLDNGRLITNGINGFVSLLDVVIPAMKARRSEAEAEPAGGVNAIMDGFGEVMGMIQASQEVTDRTEESFAVLDVAGLNYGEARYELDRDLFPNRVIVGTETLPTQIAKNWELVKSNAHVIGDFTWTGWDYLGEVGIGFVRYADGSEQGPSFGAPYPGLTAFCGDLDITGLRRPASYYREIVFGLRAAPYLAVHRPEHFGRAVASASMWAWTDTIASWTWEGFEGKPIRVDVYSAADEVELVANGEVVGRGAVGETKAFQATFELTYVPGELTAVAYSDGVETGRSSLHSGSDSLALVAAADRTELRADGSDLAFVDLTLTDESGILHNGRDRLVAVTVTGPAVLQALGSGNPSTEESFQASERSTYDGRALAIVRPTGAGRITVAAEAKDCAPVTVTLTAS
jgi:beta-galactosidase